MDGWFVKNSDVGRDSRRRDTGCDQCEGGHGSIDQLEASEKNVSSDLCQI